jgi:hypothetical protein
MSKSKVTIVFECDSKDIPSQNPLHPIEINSLVLQALLDQKLQMNITEITPNDPA